MTGKTKFKIPDYERLKQIQNESMLQDKRNIAAKLAPEEDRQGLIHLIDLEIKEAETKKN